MKTFDHYREIQPSEEYLKNHGYIYNTGKAPCRFNAETSAGDLMEDIDLPAGDVCPIRIRRLLYSDPYTLRLVWDSADPASSETTAQRIANTNPLPPKQYAHNKAADEFLGTAKQTPPQPGMHIKPEQARPTSESKPAATSKPAPAVTAKPASQVKPAPPVKGKSILGRLGIVSYK